MPTIKPTRMELLKIKKQIKLAQKGHKLLTQKRDVLIMEFFKVLKEIKAAREQIGSKLANAQLALLKAQAIEGRPNIERVATSVASGVSMEMSNKSLMGVDLPVIDKLEIHHEWHGYYGQSLELDNSIMQYREVLGDLLKLSEKQLALNRMAGEIKKTKSRVNSLEFLVIPRLQKNKKVITIKLEDIERENFSRLKIIKKKTAK